MLTGQVEALGSFWSNLQLLSTEDIYGTHHNFIHVVYA